MKKYIKSIVILLCTILTSGCSASLSAADPLERQPTVSPQLM